MAQESARHLMMALAALLLTGAAAMPSAWAQDRPPRRVLIQADTEEWVRGEYGGDLPASELAPGCVGFVDESPDVILDLEDGRWVHLLVEAGEGVDTTLVVNGPRGPLCNDDSDRHTLNPEIITFLHSGEYTVQVGGASAGERGPYRIRVAEATDTDFPEVTGERSLQLQGVSGGGFDAGRIGPTCIGAVAGRPNHLLRVERPMFIQFEAQSASDLTLVVVTEEGVMCNDDGRGTLNPQVADWFSEGLIRVYVGSHNPRNTAYYTLHIDPRLSG